MKVSSAGTFDDVEETSLIQADAKVRQSVDFSFARLLLFTTGATAGLCCH